jgi:asparagine synthase (glutamine-hydrolysing)
MCGIAGIVNFTDRYEPPSLDILRSMIGSIRHRGPDEFGLYRDAHAGLVHARLSLVDLTSGQQPMTNEDETLWIVFNGEIFNYIELKEELQTKGHIFRTRCDTEVILHAYEEWKDGCFNRFNGQWALAIWNSLSRSLVLSRDRIGIRPLYIHEDSARIWFASEVKAIFADSSVSRSIDSRGLDQTFTYWAPVAPTTIFEGVEELPPASIRTYSADGTKTQKFFWQPAYPELRYETNHKPFQFSLHEAAEILKEKLITATRLRMLRADVPVGSYLSGGLDSSLTAWMGRKAKEGDFRTFSIRFADSEFDETKFQRMMAATIDSAHEEIVIHRSDIARIFPAVIWHTERPVLRTAPAPLFLLSKLVRETGIKAVLTGEGADEMLAGYDLFREAKIRMFWSHEPDSKSRPRLFDRLYPYLARSPQSTKGWALSFWKQGLERAGAPGFSHEPRWRTTAALKRFFSGEVRDALKDTPAPDILENLPAAFHNWDPLTQAQYLEIVTLLSSYIICSQGDRMLMAHSVEGRFPFLDADVMDFCNSLPPEYTLPFLKEKFILKKIAHGLIPEEIINRQKQPYRAPDAASFIESTAPEYVSELFSEGKIKESNLFSPVAVSALYTKCISKRDQLGHQGVFSNSDNMALVGILSTQLLYDRFINNSDSNDTTNLAFKTYIDRIFVTSNL